MIGLIWAQAANGVIGRDGALPWRLPEDLAHFRMVTAGATVIMGRLTWQSLPKRFRPLPGRMNVVLTRDRAWSAPGAAVATSIPEALALVPEDAWIIGGASVYAAALPFADRVVVTELRENVTGDTLAPVLATGWLRERREPASGWHESVAGLHYRISTYLPIITERPLAT